MKCDSCQVKDASVFFTQISEGKMQKLNLCEDCAKDSGANIAPGFSLADALLGIVGEESSVSVAEQSALQCPVCGFTLNDLKKTARLGCSACYDVFSTTIEGMLKNMHKGVAHIGKSPSRQSGDVLSPQKQAEELRHQLAEAIATEQYELAAALRDKIKGIEHS